MGVSSYKMPNGHFSTANQRGGEKIFSQVLQTVHIHHFNLRWCLVGLLLNIYKFYIFASESWPRWEYVLWLFCSIFRYLSTIEEFILFPELRIHKASICSGAPFMSAGAQILNLLHIPQVSFFQNAASMNFGIRSHYKTLYSSPFSGEMGHAALCGHHQWIQFLCSWLSSPVSIQHLSTYSLAACKGAQVNVKR